LSICRLSAVLAFGWRRRPSRNPTDDTIGNENHSKEKNMSRYLRLLAALLVLTLLAAACGGGAEEPTPTTAPPAAVEQPTEEPMEEPALMNMIDIYDDLSADREFAAAFLQTGLLGSSDYLYYIPWMQATYIMAANVEALDYLPDGVDINDMTWDSSVNGARRSWMKPANRAAACRMPACSTVSCRATCGRPSPVVW
jgi:hypothetical protein